MIDSEPIAILLPPDIVAIRPPAPHAGRLHLARQERIGRALATVRTLCGRPVPGWVAQEIAGCRICTDCVAAVETQ